jgi:hypothetical protein
MKRLFIFGLMLLAMSHAVFAEESKEHQDEPNMPFIREIK